MLDDIDRECCSAIERALTTNLPEPWKIAKRTFHDPGMDLVIEHPTDGYVGSPTVIVRISYGKNS